MENENHFNAPLQLATTRCEKYNNQFLHLFNNKLITYNPHSTGCWRNSTPR